MYYNSTTIVIHKNMAKNKEYKNYNYRLDDKVHEKIKEMKYKEGISYNLLFIKLIEKYENNYNK